MKIIHILHELKYSGAEIMYVDAASLFQKKGCELTVVATANNLGEYAIQFQKAGYSVLHLPYPVKPFSFRKIKYGYSFLKLLKTEKYEVIHNHSSATYWLMALCAWLAQIKSVYTFHSIFETHWYSKPLHKLQRYTAKHWFGCRFQAISDSVHDNELNVFNNKTTKIYNWFGNKRFYPALEVEKQELRRELKIPHDSLVFITVGGCSEIKRHTDIVRALPLLINKLPNCIYLHLGEGQEEESEKELAKQLGVFDCIRFCGNHQDVRKYLVVSDFYLMTSKHEGISITTVEAMVCKIPAILYDVPGLRDFNRDTENSLLIAEDYNVLFESILTLYNNPTKSKELIENAYQFVITNFDIKKNVDLIYMLYL